MSVRLGDLAQSQKMTASLLALRTQVNETQATISSGKKSGTLAGYGTSASAVLALRAMNARTSSYVSENKIVQAQIQTMDSAMQSMGDAAQQLRTLLVARGDASADNQALYSSQIDKLLQSVETALNASYAGSYLFAGSMSDSPPVAFADPASSNADDTSYYQGDDRLAAVQADDSTKISYGVTADDPAFAKMVAALASAKAANASGDETDLAAALAASGDAISALADLRGRLGVTADTLAAVSDKLEMNALYFGNLSSELEDTDTALAMAKVSADSVALQAAYATMSKISALSLTDYIR